MDIKKTFTIFYLIISINFTLYAQEIPKNPIALYNEATQLYFNRNYKEAKKIFERLMLAFPSDTGLFGYYLNSVEQVDGKEARKEATKKCLPFYEAVSEDKRDERFYVDYISALKTVGKNIEAEKLQLLSNQKFPDKPNVRFNRYQAILKEKDVQKSAEMLLAMFNESEKNDYITREIAQSHFEIVAENSKLFSEEIVRASSERLEKLALKETEPESVKQSQLKYVSTLIRISDLLRSNFPNQSWLYLKKATEFITLNYSRNNNLNNYRFILELSELKTFLALQKWSEAQKLGAKILTILQNSNPDSATIEAEVRADYAKSLENLNQINSAREQYALASGIDSKYKPEFENFKTKYPLSLSAQKLFDQKITTAIESNIKTLEGKAKAKLAKEIINKPAKDFVITDFKGKSVGLTDYKGKVLVLSFWATWCVPCIAEFEDMKVAYAKYANNPNVTFAMVSTDEDRELVQPFVKKYNYNFPIWFAGETLEKDYQINSIPRLLIIDRSGNIRFDKGGYGKDILFLKKLDWMIESALK